MNKTLFLCLLFSSLLISCTKKENNLPKKTTGKINTISVIIDDQLWNGEIGDSIRNKFASPVIGLPEEEPLFSINQYPLKLLEGYNTATRALIIVKKESKTHFEIKKNQYASPQNVFHITGKTTTEIVNLLEKFSPQIIELIKKGEIKESQRFIQKSLLDTYLISSWFNASLKIPVGFQYVMQKSKFLWLKKEITSGNSSLVIYELPFHSLNKKKWIQSIKKIRDSVGKYINGTEPNTPMITDQGYAPYLSVSKLNGNWVYITKGTWQLKDDFMSGPFVNYAILDQPNQRILVIEGFCYSPSKEKRDIMHELEAIITSIRLNKVHLPQENSKKDDPKLEVKTF